MMNINPDGTLELTHQEVINTLIDDIDTLIREETICEKVLTQLQQLPQFQNITQVTLTNKDGETYTFNIEEEF